MRDEIGCGHVARENESNWPCIDPKKQKKAAEDFEHALHVEKGRHWWRCRGKTEEFLQPVLKEQQRGNDAQETENVWPPFLGARIE